MFTLEQLETIRQNLAKKEILVDVRDVDGLVRVAGKYALFVNPKENLYEEGIKELEVFFAKIVSDLKEEFKCSH